MMQHDTYPPESLLAGMQFLGTSRGSHLTLEQSRDNFIVLSVNFAEKIVARSFVDCPQNYGSVPGPGLRRVC
jgi:hypothetical protein